METFFENCVSEILNDVDQEKNVLKKVVIVIILESFHVVVSQVCFARSQSSWERASSSSLLGNVSMGGSQVSQNLSGPVLYE